MKRIIRGTAGLLSFIAFMLWVALGAAHATVRYVSTTGSDANPCTLVSPCATPDHAFNTVATPGDTVQVAAGTYSYGASAATFTAAGTAGNPITVTCATRGACKITNTVTGNATVVQMNGQYQVFDGFEVTNASAGNNLGIYVNASNVSLTRNTIHDIQTDCGSSGGGGIQVAVSNLTNIVIDSNRVYNISWVSGAPKCPSTTVQTDGILSEQTGFTTSTQITNNIVYNVSGGWGILASTNAQITNNTVFNTVNGGIALNNAPAGAAIQNNIIVSTGLLASDSAYYGGACAIQNGTSSTTTYGHNDLFGNHGGNYGTGFGCSGSGLQTGDIAVDPVAGTTFVNWQQNGSGDYREKVGSLTIGAGVTTSVTHDYAGATRTAPFDMGAYQFAARTLTKIDVLPPSTGFWVFSTTNTASIQLSVVCTYDNSTTDDCTGAGGVTWFSDNPSAVTVNSSGLATGTGTPTPTTGNPIIPYIGAYNGSIVGHTQLNVSAYNVTCANIRPETSTASNVVTGSTVLLSAEDCTFGDNVGGRAIGDYAAYTSSNTAVATVNQIGEVTAVGPGAAVITLHYPGYTNTRTINVLTPTQALATYYVRSDGGTIKDVNVPAGQCDGTLNVAFAGSTGGHCAVNNPMYCFTDDTSTTVYTGLLHSGDTCSITPPTPGSQSVPAGVGNRYLISYKTWGSTTQWQTAPGPSFPSGTPAHPTQIIAACSPSCSTDPDHMGNRAGLVTQGQFALNLVGIQNFIIDGIDLSSGMDCNGGLGPGTTFPCPAGFGSNTGTAFYVDDFTSNWQVKNSRAHGFTYALTGLPGPGTVFTNFSTQYNSLDGLNFDAPFGYNGNRTDGFSATNMNVRSNGFTEELLKTPSGVTRDASGNISVVFAAGQVVNYKVGTNLVLADMTPSDFNGTYPVSAITFDQQTASITGGSLADATGTGGIWAATFTTAAPAAFAAGSFVHITGVTPAFLNGYWEVHDVTSDHFVINGSSVIYGGTLSGVISSGGTASTAIQLVATGGVHSASEVTTMGTASHVYQAHRGCDQGNGGFCNGDGVGTGNNTIGAWSCVNCQFHRNAQDGWDMVHSVMTSSIMTGMLSEGNEGAPAKAGNADYALIQNNLLIATGMANTTPDPNYPPDYNQTLLTFYRGNDCSPRNNLAWQTMIVASNTYECGFNVIIDDNCNSPVGCASLPPRKFVDQNNIYLGFNDTNQATYDGAPPAIYFADNGIVPDWVFSNDLANTGGTRNPPATSTGSNWTAASVGVIQQVPDLHVLADELNALMPPINLQLAGGSIAIGAGLHNAYTPTTDYAGVVRPNPPSIGAYDLAGTPTVATPTASPAPPQTSSSPITVTLSTLTSGAAICYTINGTTPTATTAGTCDGLTYTTPLVFSSTTTLKAIGTKAANLNSGLFSGLYTITVPPPSNKMIISGTINFTSGTSQ